MWGMTSEQNQALNLSMRTNLNPDPSTEVKWNNPSFGQMELPTQPQLSSSWPASPSAVQNRNMEDKNIKRNSNSYYCPKITQDYQEPQELSLRRDYSRTCSHTQSALLRPVAIYPVARVAPFCMENEACDTAVNFLKKNDEAHLKSPNDNEAFKARYCSMTLFGENNGCPSSMSSMHDIGNQRMIAMATEWTNYIQYDINENFLNRGTPPDLTDHGKFLVSAFSDYSVSSDGRSHMYNNYLRKYTATQDETDKNSCFDNDADAYSPRIPNIEILRKPNMYNYKLENRFEFKQSQNEDEFDMSQPQAKHSGSKLQNGCSVFKPKIHLIRKFKSSTFQDQALVSSKQPFLNDENNNDIYSNGNDCYTGNYDDPEALGIFASGWGQTENDSHGSFKWINSVPVSDANNNIYHHGNIIHNMETLQKFENKAMGEYDEVMDSTSYLQNVPQRREEAVLFASPEDLHPCDTFYWCHICEKSIKNENESIIHQRSHSRAAKVNLNNYHLQVYGSMTKHWKGFNRDEKCVYICGLCEKAISYNHGFKQHIRVHGNREVCRSRNRKPQNTHHSVKSDISNDGQRSFCCDHCDKQFITKCGLRMHQQTHTSCREFACQYCGKRLSSKGSLKIHTRLHTGIYPYKCSICKKSYPQNVQLKLHMKSHKRKGEM